MSGYRAGEGRYGLAYTVDTTVGPFLNGRVSARFRVADRERAWGAGVVCRADSDRTFVAFYLTADPDTPDSSHARLAAFKYGRIVASATRRTPIPVSSGEFHLSLRFFSGDLVGEVRCDGETTSLAHLVAEVPFGGHAGLVRFYDSRVFVKDIQLEELRMTPVLPEEAEVPPARSYPFKVFLSHSQDDRPLVRKLTEQLRMNGVTYWVDEEQIQFGDQIISKIEDGLRDSRYVVACLGDGFTRSGWCRAEYGSILYREFSGDTSRRVIPLTLDGSVPSTAVPLLLSDKLRVDFTDPDSFGAFLKFLKNES
ncbi:toll/interleukin-1 receptor domain-containing protein [Micromonospora cathayae]|uniref:Toll/interleukin-1 receptor domain-containing protein n=1 Tax=Micromonospora cathayae TaxID=3028804 RepID=A0ABY7ZW37_9ACTN|nr:toll/interleukin-1 receptor domain-containing protein [Micromonospora sp. HUAS 3]WDZ87275.1 toll/interleukin-1 receptor domain-containing protein [Micromonospora sp. HUAS 3]